MQHTYPPQISVVIPCYRPNPALLRETLQSVVDQSLAYNLYEIIIVDDGSDNDEALGAFHEFKNNSNYADLNFKFTKHDENQWLAAARTTGARLSNAEFIVFLDDDDLLDADYLEKSLLLLKSSPKNDWVYTSHSKFGQRNELRHAENFSPFRFSLRNSMSYSSMFRRESWLKVGQRKQSVTGKVNQFEDWDMYVRMMSKGMIGTPLRDTKFHYRKSVGGLAARSTRVYVLSVYKLYRSNVLRFFSLPIASLLNRRNKRKGFSRLPILHPARSINSVVRFIANRFADISELPHILDFRTVLLALFRPNAFSQRILDDVSMFSLAAMRSGFEGQVDMSFTRKRNFPSQAPNNTLLAGHIWWQMGGAEIIYWYWLQSARAAGSEKIINLVSYDDAESGVFKQDFAKLSNTQYNLFGFGDTPLQRLKAAWNLIDLERPKVVFISSNSFLYQLTPYIKREFPSIKIIDILHNEYDGLVDWYTISADYIEYIDKRIVTSPYWRDVLIEKYKVEPEKIILARNPVDTDLYDPGKFDRDAILKSYKIDPKKKVITFVGRLHPQKGVDVFLELAEALNTNPDFHFVIAGDGELLSSVEDKVKTLKSLSFLGYFRTVERVLAMTDILICPSLYEGAPLIGLEAAAMNTAVIAPNLVGFKEQITEGNYGRLYEAELEVQKDVYVLKTILEEEVDQLMALAKNGRKFAHEKHALTVVGERYQQALSELLRV